MRNPDQAADSQHSRRARQICFGLALFLSSGLLFAERSVLAQAGGKKPETKKSGQEKTPDSKSEESKIDPDALPPGYQPPPEPLAIMDLVQPIIEKEEIDRLTKESRNFTKVKIECDLSASGRKTIESYVRLRLASMTLPSKDDKKLDPLSEAHRKFLTEITTSNIVNKPPATVQAMGVVIGNEVLKQMPELLKNNFYVRLHAVMILGEMDYAPAYELLLEVLQAEVLKGKEVEGQPYSIKIPAVMGLIRIMTFANPPPAVKERTQIAHVLVDELAKKDTEPWYQMRLVEALRYCDTNGLDAGNNNKPFVVDALLDVINDADRSWIVRSKACYTIGRVPLQPTKFDEVLLAVSNCALQTSNAAAAKPKNPIWKNCFWEIYLAFQANNPSKEKKDLDAEKKRAGGLLGLNKAAAKPVYDLIYPIASDILNDKAPAAGDIAKLVDLIKTLLPKDAPPPKGASPQPNG